MKKIVFLLSLLLTVTLAAQGQLIKNGDFTEKTTVGLPKFWRVVTKDVQNVQVYDSGSGNAVKMTPQSKERMFLIQYPVQKLIPGTRYKVTYEVKSANKTLHRVYVDYRDEFGKLRCSDGSWNYTPDQWSKQSFTFLYPMKATGGYLVLNPDSNAGAVVEFRNVRFEAAADNNVLKNPEFTLRSPKGEVKAWHVLNKGASIKLEDDALRITSSGKKTANVAQWDIPVVPGQSYKISAEVRAKDNGSFRIYMEWRMPDPANPKGKGRLSSTGGWWRKVTSDWRKDSFTVNYPANGKSAYLILSGSGSDYVEFRNVKVEPVNKDAASLNAPAAETPKAAVKAAPAVKKSAAPVEVAADGNLVRNPTFAADSKGKLSDWHLLSGKFESADGILKLLIGEDVTAATIAQWNLNVTAGKSYKVTAEVRASAPGSYRIYGEWRLPDPANPKAKGRLSSYGGWWRSVDTKWKKETFTINLPENAKGAYLILSGKNASRVEFRNVRVAETSAPVPKEAALAGGKWKIGDTAKFTVKDGKVILTISPDNGKNGVVSLTNVRVAPGKRYAFKYTIQGKGRAGSDTGFHPFRISVILPGVRDDGGPWDDTQNGIRNKSFEFTVPLSITSYKAQIKIETTTRGSVDFWNMEFVELPPKAQELLKVELLSPFFRDTLYAGNREKSISGEILAESSAAEVILRDNKKKQVTAVKVEMKNGKGSFLIPAEKLPYGTYMLEVSASVNGSRAEIKREIIKLAPAPSQVAFDGKNFLLNGKKFLPVICWTIAGTKSDESDEQIARGFYHAAKNGINSTIIRVSSCESALRYLNIAQKYGIKIFLATGNSPSANLNTLALWEHQLSGLLTAEVINHPALIGYFLVDEPYWRGIPADALIASYKILKTIDPNHPVWINAAPRGSVEVHAEYSKAADIYGVDVYPVGSPGHSGLDDKGLSSIGKYVVRMTKSCGTHKPIIMALQGFAWGVYSGRKALYPTFEELRFMTYDAITSKGIGASYWGTQDIDNDSFYTDVLYKVTGELQQVSGILTAEKIAAVKSFNKDINIFAREIDGKIYMITANTSNGRVKGTFSGMHNGKLTVVNENRSVNVSDGKFTDDFAPYGVHIYAEGALPPVNYAIPAKDDAAEAKGNPVFSFMKEKLSRVPYNGSASWLWVKGLERRPYSKAYLAKEFTLGKAVKSAQLIISADDTYKVWINGKAADVDFPKSGTWDLADVIDVTKFVNAGNNIITIEGADGGVVPCGVIADLVITFTDGSKLHVVTDGSWNANGEKVDSWQTPAVFGKWGKASVVAPYGTGPWSNKMKMKSASK